MKLKTQDEQPRQIQQARLAEKRLQELRLFALEYVKLIVAKANELSHDRQLQASYTANKHAGPQATWPTVIGSDQLPASRVIRQAASQIDERFRYQDSRQTKQAQKQCQFQLKTPSPLVQARGQQGAENWPSGGQLDWATSADLQSPQSANSSPLAGGRDRQSRQKRRLTDRLNWHLLISCFSTCLPETLLSADSMPSGPSAV